MIDVGPIIICPYFILNHNIKFQIMNYGYKIERSSFTVKKKCYYIKNKINGLERIKRSTKKEQGSQGSSEYLN